MGDLNSSGARERFTLAAGESKDFRNKISPFGTELGNQVQLMVHGEEDVAADSSPVNTGSAVVKLQTSENGSSFSDVATVTIVGRGVAPLSGAVGAYFRVLNVAGPGLAHVELHTLGVVPQVTPSL